MINYKEKYKLEGNNLWPSISSVFIKGVPEKADINHNEISDENAKKILSWNNVVILKASSVEPVSFYVGFSHNKAMKYLDLELRTDMIFGLRLGPNDIRFFVFPKNNLEYEIKLEIIEKTTEDDLKYADAILF